MGPPLTPNRDPRQIAPVGAYFKDASETMMVRILEADYAGALGEDVVTETLVEISRIDLLQKWTRVRPLAQATAGWGGERV